MNTMFDNEIIIGKDFYLWKNARIYFQYDEKIDGYCLFDASGFADDLFIPQDINGIPIKNIYGEEAIFKGTMRINFPELKKSNISQLNSQIEKAG